MHLPFDDVCVLLRPGPAVRVLKVEGRVFPACNGTPPSLSQIRVSYTGTAIVYSQAVQVSLGSLLDLAKQCVLPQ